MIKGSRSPLKSVMSGCDEASVLHELLVSLGFDCRTSQIGEEKGGWKTKSPLIKVQSLIGKSELDWWLGRFKQQY